MRRHVVKFHIFRLGSADSAAPTFTNSHGLFYLLWNVSALFSNVTHAIGFAGSERSGMRCAETLPD